MIAAYTTLADQLKNATAAVRVQFHWLGMRRSLEVGQRAKAAETFGANFHYLSASQKLFDTKHPLLQRLSTIKNEITAYWKLNTLPFTEEGVRLIAKDKIDSFIEQMSEFRSQLQSATNELHNHYDEVKDRAKERLGELYNPSHYPADISECFSVEWDFPNVDPPSYLAQINPDLYEQEQKKALQRFEEAIELAENAFLNEFQTLVSTLQEKLTPGPGGEQKIFQASTVTNLTAFFERFKTLNIGSNQDLDNLVEQAQALVKGIDAKDLRKGELLRLEIANGLSKINDQLQPLVVQKPRRSILTPSPEVPECISA